MTTHETKTSSNIAKIQHENETLIVQFRNGRKYKFEGVSSDTFKQFVDSTSAGQFFSQRIKNAYKGEEI